MDQSIVIKSLNVLRAIELRIKIVFWEQYIHTMMFVPIFISDF